MFYIAQIPRGPTEEWDFSCPQQQDQIIALGIIWLGLIAICLLLLLVFFLLKKPKFGFIFTALLIGLIAAKLLSSTDNCGHGGMFSGSGNGFYILLAFSILIFTSLILAVISIVKSKKSKNR